MGIEYIVNGMGFYSHYVDAELTRQYFCYPNPNHLITITCYSQSTEVSAFYIKEDTKLVSATQVSHPVIAQTASCSCDPEGDPMRFHVRDPNSNDVPFSRPDFYLIGNLHQIFSHD